MKTLAEITKTENEMEGWQPNSDLRFRKLPNGEEIAVLPAQCHSG